MKRHNGFWGCDDLLLLGLGVVDLGSTLGVVDLRSTFGVVDLGSTFGVVDLGSTFGLVDLGSTLGVVSAFFGIVTFVGAFEVSGEGSFLDVVMYLFWGLY